MPQVWEALLHSRGLDALYNGRQTEASELQKMLREGGIKVLITEKLLKENARKYLKNGHALVVAEMNGDFPKAGAAGEGLACIMCLALLVRQLAKQTDTEPMEVLTVIEEMIHEVENT